MQSKNDALTAKLRVLLDSKNAPLEEINDAASALLKLVARQNRQLDQLTKLSDASESKLTQTNTTLSQLTENLARFVPQTVVDQLMLSGSDRLATKARRELSAFFSDIVGFTAMTERLEPEQLSMLLGDYFTEMNIVCDRWGGTLDQFIGDAIVIFFGAPQSNGAETDAANAVGMAIDMQTRLHALRIKWADWGLRPPLHVRMGISTGYATVGNFGSDRRMHYTAIGNTVNEASRIQDLCNPDSIMIAADTQLRIRETYSSSPRETVTLKGRQNPVQLYEVDIEQKNKTSALVAGSGDGFRIYMDNSVISDKQAARELLNTALANLDETEEADNDQAEFSANL